MATKQQRQEVIDKYHIVINTSIGDDRVFGDRTNIFLLVNSIMFIGANYFDTLKPLISGAGVVLGVLWFYISHLSLKAHKFWINELIALETKMFENPHRDGLFTKKKDQTRFGIGSTNLMARALPLLFFGMWAYIIMTK